MTNDSKKTGWSVQYDNAPGELTFNYNGDECLKSSGVELGILLEQYGFEEKNRLHQSDKNNTCWIETETKHPFGAEPVIRHKYEQASNHIRVTTDIQISHQVPMENMVIDNLLMPGEWKKIEILQFESKDSVKIIKKEYDVESFSELKFESIPLIILFTKSDDRQLEIGCGYDLWRWNIASRFDTEPEFTLTKEQDGIRFIRKVATWNEKYTMEKNNFRFSWYFAWGNSSDNCTAVECQQPNKLIFQKNELKLTEDKNDSVFDFVIGSENIPDNIKKSNSDEICFCSRYFVNSFKHWLRSIYNEYKYEELEITLRGLKPGVCSKSNHIANRTKKERNHFDYLYLFGIWEWANQYLGDSSINFNIELDSSSIYGNLPSAKGMLANK
jgi:hypothetical protein